MPDIQDKQGNPIQEGDHVWTRARGGKHEGNVRLQQLSSVVTADYMTPG